MQHVDFAGPHGPARLARAAVRAAVLGAVVLGGVLLGGASRGRADCTQLDDPFQVIEINLEMSPSDWDTIRFDEQGEIEVPATFRACDERPQAVRVRRKQGDLLMNEEDPQKISLKVDFDDRLPDAHWHGHRKLSLEAGRGLGRGLVLREAFSWQIFRRSGMITGGGAWVQVSMNGVRLGVYTRAEQVDKSYLRRHIGEDEGFLYKLDYRNDGGKRRRLTREDEPDPYAANLCYLPFDEVCQRPDNAYVRLGHHVDLNQILLFAAVNAFLANFDSPFFVDNNYFWYNSERPRLFFPWDLDLALLTGMELTDPHEPAKPSEWLPFFMERPELRAAFDEHLARLEDDAFPPEVLERFLDKLVPAIGPAIDADRHSDVDISFANEVEKLRAFLRKRAEFVRGTLSAEARRPYPVAINEVLASNAGALADESGAYTPWVELYNRSSEPAVLLGLFLSDDPADPRKWRLPGDVLPPGGRLLVWCDGLGEAPLHAGFRLSPAGGVVGLYEIPDRAPSGIYHLVDFIRFDAQETDVALARLPDGEPGFVAVRCPTPGAPNLGDCPAEASRFTRGDVNGDGALDLADPIGVLGGLFLGAGFACVDAADADDGGTLDITDAIALLDHLFQGGPPPREPRAGCGRDPTPDELRCQEPGRCRT